MHAPALLAKRQACSACLSHIVFWHRLRLPKPCLTVLSFCGGERQALFVQSNYRRKVMEPRRSLGKEEK